MLQKATVDISQAKHLHWKMRKLVVFWSFKGNKKGTLAYYGLIIIALFSVICTYHILQQLTLCIYWAQTKNKQKETQFFPIYVSDAFYLTHINATDIFCTYPTIVAQILDRGMIVGFSFKRIFKRTLQANTYLGQQHWLQKKTSKLRIILYTTQHTLHYTHYILYSPGAYGDVFPHLVQKLWPKTWCLCLGGINFFFVSCTSSEAH